MGPMPQTGMDSSNISGPQHNMVFNQSQVSTNRSPSRIGHGPGGTGQTLEILPLKKLELDNLTEQHQQVLRDTYNYQESGLINIQISQQNTNNNIKMTSSIRSHSKLSQSKKPNGGRTLDSQNLNNVSIYQPMAKHIPTDNSQNSSTPVAQVINQKGQKVSKDFKAAYNNLAKNIIKQALFEHQPVGVKALILSQKDVHEFEKQQNLKYFSKLQQDQNSLGNIQQKPQNDQLKIKVSQLIKEDVQNSKRSKRSLNQSVLENGKAHHDLLYEKGVKHLEYKKIIAMSNESELQALQECSFKPQLISNQQKYRMSNRRRSMDEFYQDQVKVLETKALKVQQQKDLENQEFHKIKDQGQEVVQKTERYYSKLKQSFVHENNERNTSQENRHQNKENATKNQQELHGQNFSFRPQINEKSRRIQRTASVEDILYDDAQNRIQKKQSFAQHYQKNILKSPNFSLQQSDNFLAQRLEHEIQENLINYDLKEELNFNNFKLLLESMGYYTEQTLAQVNYIRMINERAGKNLQTQDEMLKNAFIIIGQGKQQVNLLEFKAFIFALNNLYFDWMSQDAQKEKQNISPSKSQRSNEQQADRSQGFEQEAQNVKVASISLANQNARTFYVQDKQQCKSLIVKFLEFVENRKSYLQAKQKFTFQQKKNSIQEQNNQQLHQSRIMINGASNNMAQHYYSHLSQGDSFQGHSHVDLLLLQQEEYKQKHEMMRREQDMQEMQECSFHPQTLNHISSRGGNNHNQSVQSMNKNSSRLNTKRGSMEISNNQKLLQGPPSNATQYVLNNLYKHRPNNQKPQRETNDIEYENQKQECTFRPNSRLRTSNQTNNQPSKTQSQMNHQKLQPAKLPIQKQSQNQLQSHKSLDQLLEPYCMEVSQNLLDKTLIEQSVISSQDDRNPILLLDVNLGNDEMSRIIIFEGDNAQDVADNFCRDNQLDEKKKAKLLNIIQAQMNTILPKIDEENE
eukprot:403361937